MFDYIAALFASKSVQSGIAGAAGGGVSALVSKLPPKMVLRYILVGALTSGFSGVGVADILGIPDQYQTVAFFIGSLSFTFILSVNMFDWKSAIAKRIGGGK